MPILILTASGIVLLPGFAGDQSGPAERLAGARQAPVMSVAVTEARAMQLPIQVSATGKIAAWQEASLGAEGDKLRLMEVRVNVGDAVKRGQELAVFNSDILAAELAESVAAVAQAEARALEADANHRRAESLAGSGAISAQQIDAHALAANSARAELAARRATELRSRLRLSKAQLLAPSDGVISARHATVGSVVSAGQELFRLIEDGRLEWRAEVSAADLDRLRPGQVAWLTIEGQAPIRGELRTVAPTIDTERLSGLAYVDLPAGSPARAGAFVRGRIEIGDAIALTVPHTAVLLRDGYHSVFRVGSDSVVRSTQVEIGRRSDTHLEVVRGLTAGERVVASGLAFLNDGDLVQIVESPAQETSEATSAPVGTAPTNGTSSVGGQ
jgi:RND family efflux transporter MFP subunit